MTQRARFDIRQAGKRIALVLGVIAAVNLAFYLVFARPAVQEYRALQAEARQDRLDGRREQVERRESYLTGLEQAEQSLQYLRSEVLSTRADRLVEVQEEVTELTRQFNIDQQSVKYADEMMLDEGLERLSIDLPLEGGYTALRRFLQAVEQSDKFLLVERVALAKGKRGGVMLQLSITLATYFNAPEDMMRRKQQLERRGRRVRA